MHHRLVVSVFLSLLLSFALLAQTPPQGGVSTGPAATYTSRRTAGITDPNAPVVFEDVTDKTALANFRHHSGEAAKDYIFETTSGGAAIFDYDGDGRPDIYLVNGSTNAAMRGKEKAPRAALYRNLGNWKFEDVTDKAGVPPLSQQRRRHVHRRRGETGRRAQRLEHGRKLG
jgi:enediyne biosynthesis protein E4